MIYNGTIKTLFSASGTLDSDGDPVESTPSWSDDIQCQIRTIKHNNKGIYQDGKFIQSSYEILVKMQTIDTKRIKITDERSKELGEFEVQDIEYLNSVQMVKITV